MKYISTRGRGGEHSFSAAVMSGLAADGGLFMPDHFPQIAGFMPDWQALSYSELAYEVMRLYADLPAEDLHEIIDRSYAAFDAAEVTPLRQVGDSYILELFHGPTLAFKDVALQFIGNLFEYLLERADSRMNILAATSGDTGSAAIYGVRGRERIKIFVMHPDGRTSPVQRLQMTTVGDANVFNLAVNGTFDDCQELLKALLNDAEFKVRCRLGAVNSINWARILAQIVYYIYAWLRLRERTGCDKVRFSVPTGNFGDIFAGYVASRMGLPVGRLVLATNENNILAGFFRRGEYRRGEVVATISPSMDIQVASNFERYLYCRTNGDGAAVARMMREFSAGGRIRVPVEEDGSVDALISAGTADSALTLRTIRKCYEAHGYLPDPHTAAAYAVSRDFISDDEPMVVLATAHPAKFGAAIVQAVGEDIAHHPRLDALAGLPERYDRIDVDAAALRNYIAGRAC